MSEPELRTATNDIHVLWQRLTAELATIYDAHGVCASVAYEIAVRRKLAEARGTGRVGLHESMG